MAVLIRAAGIRTGEGRTLALVALLFLALETGRGFGEVGVDTLVVSRFGAGTLPYLFIALGVSSMVAALAYGAALMRVARTPLLVGALGGAALLLLAGRLTMAGGSDAAVPVIWLITYASGTLAGTIAWTVAGSVFDARQAKRLFPLCTGAAIAGNFVGSLASGAIAGAAGTELLVVLEAALLAVVGALIVVVMRTGHPRIPVRESQGSMVRDLRVGFDAVVRSPLFRLIALAYVLFSILYFSITYPFLQAASTAFPQESDLATALGLLSAATTATAFVASLAIANRVYARLGVATTALALPLVYVVGFGLWLVQFSFATAAIVRFAQQVTQRGLSNAAWSAFYNVLPTERRAQVLAFVDGVPGQIGMMASGLLLLGAGSLFALNQIFWLGGITGILLTIVVIAIRRRYGGSLIATLRSGRGEQVLEGGPGLSVLARDPQVLAALSAAATAPDPAVRRMAIALLGRVATAESKEMLTAALEDPEPGVRAAALGGLTLLPHDQVPVQAIFRSLADADETVRASAVRALGLVGTEAAEPAIAPLREDPSAAVRAAVAVAMDGMGASPGDVARLLRDPSSEVRHATVEAVAAVGGLRRGETIAAELVEALDDDSTWVRRTAAGLLASRDADTAGVLDVLLTGSPRAQEAALLALDGHAQAVRSEISTWAEQQILRATDWRAARRSLETDGADLEADTAVGFLAAVLERRERGLADRTLGALAVLGAPEAQGVIRRCLRSADQETRAQALEALESLGDRRLSRAIVSFLDADAGGFGPGHDIVLDRLVDDEDRWVRSLAERTIEDQRGAAGLSQTERSMSEIDTMLLLRRVPLFASLEPEDLQRIARTCSERTYPAEAMLMREGDIGNELLVLVEGTVRVVRIDAAGNERLIRTYEPGDHIGELAVLRERPRAASVIADTDVRGLVIDGANLNAILRERPDAAMAMLATLAERISVQ
jgi:HEAT repeat protein/ATP/ADP translocase